VKLRVKFNPSEAENILGLWHVQKRVFWFYWRTQYVSAFEETAHQYKKFLEEGKIK